MEPEVFYFDVVLWHPCCDDLCAVLTVLVACSMFGKDQTCQQSSYDIMLCIVNVLAHPTCGVQDSLLKFT